MWAIPEGETPPLMTIGDLVGPEGVMRVAVALAVAAAASDLVWIDGSVLAVGAHRCAQ